jgi:hypothetical protein
LISDQKKNRHTIRRIILSYRYPFNTAMPAREKPSDAWPCCLCVSIGSSFSE